MDPNPITSSYPVRIRFISFSGRAQEQGEKVRGEESHPTSAAMAMVRRFLFATCPHAAAM
jgi:hypothetical protein